jgi:hypothetical protein
MARKAKAANKLVTAAIYSSVLILPLNANAFSLPDDFLTVGATVSSLGVGGEIDLKVHKHMNLKLTTHHLRVGQDVDHKYVDIYDTTVRLQNYGVLMDFYPFTDSFKGFFVSSGVYINDNRVDGQALPKRNITVFGHTYTPQQIGKINGEVRFLATSPFIGFGYNWKRNSQRKWGFSVEAGVLFQGRPKADITFTGTLAEIDTVLANQMRNDLEKVLELEIDRTYVRYYPAVRFTAQLGVI